MAIVKMAIGYKKVAAAVLGDSKIKQKINQDIESIHHIEQKPLELPETSTQTNLAKEVMDYCDGLIVDVTNFNFEPAMVNRIFNNNKVIYDPTKVPQSVIVQRGLAAYTISINKAKAILDGYGSKNPCMAKTIKLKTNTDVEIDENGANKIISSNAQNGFLEAAKVVFILNN